MELIRTGALLEKKFNEYLFPSIISAVSVLLASFVDGIIVSKLISDDAFAAVNLAEPVVLFMQALFFLFGIGGAITISIARGQRNEKKANALFTLTFFGAAAVSLVVTVTGVLLVDPITSVLCSTPQLTEGVRNYVFYNIAGSFFMIVVPCMVYMIRVDGLPNFSARILLVSNAVNLMMDFVYIGFLHMDTAGAGLATVTGYAVGFCMELYYLFICKKRTLRFIKLKKEDFRYLGELCLGGIVSVVNTILFFIKSILVNRIVQATGGADAMAVFSVCNFTVTFIFMFITGGADTMTPIIGLLYGEQDYRGMDIVLKKTFRFVLFSCALAILLIALFPQLILQLFSVTSPVRVEMGTAALRIFSLSFIGMGICTIMMNYLQASRQKAISMMISWLRGMILAVPLTYGLSLAFGITGTWWSFVITETLTAAVTFLVCFMISRVRRDKYSGILLHERQNEKGLYDVSLQPEVSQVHAVASELVDFCKANGVEINKALYTGVLAEEIVENIRQFNRDKKQPQIDLICRLTDQKIILSIRDNGETFDSIVVDEDCEEFTNLKMIHLIADTVDYSRSLGLNNMLVTIANVSGE